MLVSCGLLQVGEGDRTLSMHDQLHDLAHSIVRAECSSLSQRTRLLGRDAEDALKSRVRIPGNKRCCVACYVVASHGMKGQ